MSIASELTNLEGNIEDSYDAVNDMGGVIPAQKNMDNLDQAIRTIPQNQGTTYTAGNGIDITNDVISIDDTVVAELSDLPGVMTGATSSTAGTSGLTPAPAVGDQDKFLKGDGTWATVSGGPTVHTVTMYAYDGTINIALDDIPKVSFNPAFEENNVAVGIDNIVGWFNAGEDVIIETTGQRAKVISASTDINGDVYTFTIAVNAMGDPWAATTATPVASSGSCGVPYVIDFVLNTITHTKIAIPHVPGKYTILLEIVPVDYPTASWTIDFQNVQNASWFVGIPSYDPLPSWAVPVAVPSGSRAESAAAFLMMAHMSGMAIELAAIGVTNQQNVQVNTIPYVTAKSFSSSITNSNGSVLPIFSSANNATQQYQYMPIANFFNINMRKGIWPVMGTNISGAAYFELNFTFIYRQSRGSNPSYGSLYAEVTGSGSLTNIRWDGTLK